MKVTQKEYDEMQVDLEYIERILDIKYKGVDHWESKWQEAQEWLKKAEIEKDLSVDVRNIELIYYGLRGKYKNKSYLLPGRFNWDFARSPGGNKLLVPTEKE